MKLYYATSNAGKLKSLQRDLSEFAIDVYSPSEKLMLDEIQSLNVTDISAHKAKQAYEILKAPVVCQDSGFCVKALGGWPGADVKNILDNKHMGITSILKVMEGVVNRDATFDQCLAFYDGKMAEPVTFLEHVYGTIADEPLGTVQSYHWSRLALIFIPNNERVTLAQMSEEEYSLWRGRARQETAAKHLGQWLLENRL